jgi:Tat protein translocase TatB subunit
MFGIGLPELIVIAALALLVLGPERLPELARWLGRSLHDLKRAGQDVRDEFQAGMADVESPMTEGGGASAALAASEPPVPPNV